MWYVKAMIASVAILVAVEGSVHAYTDPGSGTMLLQMLAALAVGLLFYIRRITAWARSRLSSAKGRSQTESAEAESREGSRQVVEE